MSTITLTSLATAAALDLGAIDPAEGLTSTQIANALVAGNQMLGSWSIDQRFILQVLKTTASLVSGTQSYTIGTGGAINVARPAAIVAASATVTTAASAAYSATGDPQYAPGGAGSQMVVPLKILTAEEWTAFPNRGLLQVFPKGLFYDRQNNAGLGTVYIAPNQLGGSLEIITWTALSQFVDATTPLTVPDPSYLELMEYGLAVRMAPQFPGLIIPDTVKLLYTDAENRVKTLNSQLLGAQGAQPAAAAPVQGAQ